MNSAEIEAESKFAEYTVSHPHIERAYRTALDAIRGANHSPQVVIIAGPTGVGKTRLAKSLYRQLGKDYKTESASSPEQIPVLFGNAVATLGASFSWKDFITRLLTRAGEPLTDKKLAIAEQQNLFADLPLIRFKENSTTDALRIALEKCLRERKVRTLIIDEAHHMLMVKNKSDRSTLEFQFEAIKSLALETQTTIVLIGTYRLLDIRDLSGQLIRRSEIIHFPRYDVRIEGQRKQFAAVLKQFLAKLPISHPFLVGRDLDHFYNKCCGEVGILKDWLVRALNRYYQSEKRPAFDHAFIDGYALANKALRTIATEALLGEEKLGDISEDELRKLYIEGIPQIPDGMQKPQGKRPPPGRRKPARDPVGAPNA